MKKLLLLLLFAILTVPAFAETLNLASKGYVQDNYASKSYVQENCAMVYQGINNTQILPANYIVYGSMEVYDTVTVPTPPLPPEE